MANVFDKKSTFFKSYFNKALSYQDFVKSGSSGQADRWNNFSDKIILNEEQKNLLKGFKREMNILVLAGIWCGDCARQCPMINRIAEASSVINLKIIDNETFAELRDEFRICGGSRVPVAVILSEDYFEVSRTGDRMLSVYRKKAVNELGDACDPGLLPPPAEELNKELSEWLEFTEKAQLMLRLSPFLRSRHRD